MHYGLFTFVHGVFVVVMIALVPIMTDTPAVPFNPLWIVLVWLLTTLVQWFLALRTDPPPVAGIAKAYGRVIVLHLTVIGAVWLIAAFGLPSIVAVFLVVLHAIVDIIGLVVTSRMASGRYRWEPGRNGTWLLRRKPDTAEDPGPTWHRRPE